MSEPPQGFDGLLNMQGLMQAAQKMQERLKDAQSDLSTLQASASSGGGMVTATVDGNHRLLSLRFDPQIVASEEVEMLQDLTVAAVNMATQRVQEAIKERMGQVTGGMNLPFDLSQLGG